VCRVSTVDRFQGDESDVVIISLVVDSRSQSQFVMLQNRMIVLLSRARLGMFITSNSGYFEGRASRSNTAKHWENTFQMLQLPAVSD
jgi:superfamily I DNA and/or RNA helicase